MEPETDGFQKETPFGGADFQMNHVKPREGKMKWSSKVPLQHHPIAAKYGSVYFIQIRLLAY